MSPSIVSKPRAAASKPAADVQLYVHLMSSHLKRIAEEGGLDFLAYLLSMVAEEAGGAQSHRRGATGIPRKR